MMTIFVDDLRIVTLQSVVILMEKSKNHLQCKCIVFSTYLLTTARCIILYTYGIFVV